MASAFDLSALTAYVKENQDEMISTMVIGAKTLEIIRAEGNVQTGIKTSERLHVLEVDAEWQEGDGCGFNPSGDTDITERLLTVGNIKINIEWCLDDLRHYYTQEQMRQGALASIEEMPARLERRILDRLTAKQRYNMERAVWQGNTTSTDDKLKHFDGFLKLLNTSASATWSNTTAGTGTITAATNSTTVTGSGTAFSTQVAVGDMLYRYGQYIGTVTAIASNTSLTIGANAAIAVTAGSYQILPVAQQGQDTTSNAIARVDALYGSIPLSVLNGDGRLWIGQDETRTWLRALTTANMFHYQSEGNMVTDGFTLPGTNLRVTPTTGLNGTYQKVVMSPSNMYYGTDLENDYETYKMWFDDNTELLRLKARWRSGVQIGFPQETVGAL